jgi:hypothetical protein
MVLSNEATKTIIEKFPNLQKSEHWTYYCSLMDYEDGEKLLKISELMIILTDYVNDILNMLCIPTEKEKELEEIFSLVEFFLNEGEFSVKAAAATCFLENLINYTSAGRLMPEKLNFYLVGKKSIEYCKAWDEFTGVKTPGLWSEGEEFDGQFKKWIQSDSK